MHDVFLFPAASSTVVARPFKGLCMGGFRVVSPRNFSDFPGRSQLFPNRCADWRLVDGIYPGASFVTVYPDVKHGVFSFQV